MKKSEAVGYAKFLLHKAEHEERCVHHLSLGICDYLGFQLKELDEIDRQAVEDGAYFLMRMLNRAGWDLMFDEKGTFKGVIT